MKFCINTIFLLLLPLSGHTTQLLSPVTITGSYSVKSTDPRFEGRFYPFRITLKNGQDYYYGTIERPVVEYTTNGVITSELVTFYIDTIKGKWSLNTKTIIIDFPHVENIEKIEAKSDNNFKVKLQNLNIKNVKPI